MKKTLKQKDFSKTKGIVLEHCSECWYINFPAFLKRMKTNEELKHMTKEGGMSHV